MADLNKITLILTLSELNTIVETMNSYAALHISANYEAEELAERLEAYITAIEVDAYD